jgi:hypothetical protein
MKLWLILISVLAALAGVVSGWLSVPEAEKRGGMPQERNWECPASAAEVSVDTDLNLWLRQVNVSYSSRVQVKADNVEPSEIAESNHSSFGELTPSDIAECFLRGGSSFRVDAFTWSDGSTYVDLSTAESELPVMNRSWNPARADDGLVAWLGDRTAYIVFSPCRAANPKTLSCSTKAGGRLRLTVPEELLPIRSNLPPSRLIRTVGDAKQLTFIWQYRRKPPDIEVQFPLSQVVWKSAQIQDYAALNWDMNLAKRLSVTLSMSPLIGQFSQLLLVFCGLLVIRLFSGRWRGWTVGLGLFFAVIAFVGLEARYSLLWPPWAELENPPSWLRYLVGPVAAMGISWLIVTLLLSLRSGLGWILLSVAVFGLFAVGVIVAYVEAPSRSRPSELWYPSC